MKRGESRYTGGCFPEAGTLGAKGRCWLCGYEWLQENCCGSQECPCWAMAESWHDVSYKNVVLLICHWLALPYGYFWERWYS